VSRWLPLWLSLAVLPALRAAPPPDWSGHRQYAPDRQAAIEHIALDITPDFQHRSISGLAVLAFHPIATPLVQLKLDAVNLDIQSVDSTEKIDAFQVTSDSLIITFAAPIPPDKKAGVTIHYSAEPQKGLLFRTPEMGYPAGDEHLFTQGESIDARQWYPSYDSPNEKFTSEITCHVPEDMTVLSNGRLVSEVKEAGGRKAVHWMQEQPQANYLVALVAGYFKSIQDHHNNVPLAFYTPPSDIAQASNSFADTADIMAFYEQDIGVPFPWDKYYQVVVQDFGGGMENTSLTILTKNTLFTPATENIRDSDGLIAHEMAHQWFGDLVTCKDWSHIWLNEGFATFYALLYDGHKNGPDSMLYGLYSTARGIFSVPNDVKPIVSREFDDPEQLFNYLPYQKGCYVLRMLRAQLDDDLFRQCIRAYLERHKFGSVVTDDLASVIEELSGRSFDQFFDQWVYHAHYPELSASYSWDQKAKMAKISIRQNQKVSEDVLLFNFPLTVAFKTKSGRVESTVTVKDKSEDFYFPLPQEPLTVRLDPHLALLASIHFENLPPPLLDAQLEDPDDMPGRLLAIESLKDQATLQAVEKLKRLLNHDPFFGVRREAAKALRAIHSDDSLQALLASTQQPDARVRQDVMAAIAAFYDARALAAQRAALTSERNPDVEAESIRGLGQYAAADVRDLLLPLLQSQSYRNTILDSAIDAIRAQDDPTYIAPLRQTLKDRKLEMTARGFTGGLDTLALLARDAGRKEEARDFLLGFVNDKRLAIQLGAIRALGTLEDPAAIAVLETFAGASRQNPAQRAAADSLAAIRTARKTDDNLKELRQTVLDLKKEQEKLRHDLDALQKKADATKSRHSASGKSSHP